MTETTEALLARCRACGLPLTAPRRAILDAMLQEGAPIDAVALLQAARKRHAGTSTGTVYRFLRELERNGLAQAQARPHSRMQWRLCTQTLPADRDELQDMLESLRGFLRAMEALVMPPTIDPGDQPLPLQLQRLVAQLGERLPARKTNPPY